MQPDAEVNVVNDCQKQNGCVVMEQNEYLKENDTYSGRSMNSREFQFALLIFNLIYRI